MHKHTYFTGPNADHTSGKGQYLYIEASRPQQKGDRAVLSYKFYQPTSHACLSLYYYMFGRDISSLQVWMKVNSSMTKRWSLTGPQGSSWKSADISIPSQTTQVCCLDTSWGFNKKLK